jgi:hypothetical protein
MQEVYICILNEENKEKKSCCNKLRFSEILYLKKEIRRKSEKIV